MSDEPKCGPCADGRPCADHPRPPVSDQTSSPETWVCRASHVAYGYCTSPVGVLPGHGACGPAVPPAPTPEPLAADERFCTKTDGCNIAGPDHAPPCWVVGGPGRSTPAPSPSQPEPGGQDGYLAWLRETHDGACRFCGMGNETVDQHAGSCAAMRLLEGWQILGPRPAPPAVPGDRPDPLADLVPLAEDVLDAATDRSGFRNGRLLADAVIDADAQPAHPAPDGEPGSLHLGAEDRFHLWAHINTIHQETAPTQRGLTEITFDHVHEEAACALAYFDPAPPGGYGVADGTAK